ncbi:MAG: GerAB/ArcD/ProY family transporter [Bacteroidota bacterium]
MSKEETAIGAWLYLPLLIIPVLGYGLMNMPHYAAKEMGANGYLAELIAGLIVLPGIVAIYLLARRFPGQTIIEQGSSILGNLPGRIIGLIYIVNSLIILTMFTRDTVNMVNVYFLNRSPVYAIALIFLIFSAFAASQGVEALARLNSFLLIPALLVLFFLTALGFQNVNWINVLPVTSPNAFDYFKGGMSVVYIYYFFGASAMTLPFLKPIKSYPRLAGGALLFTAIFYAVYAFGAIGVFGDTFLYRYAWPSLEFVRTIDQPFHFFEQAGLLMLIDWITMIVAGTAYLYYAVALGSAQLTGILNYKWWVFLLFPVKLMMVLLPRNVSESKMVVDQIAKYGWIMLFAYPVFLLFLAIILRRRGKLNNAS